MKLKRIASPQEPTNSITSPGKAAPPPSDTAAPHAAATRAATTPININTASATELDTLPGICKARAAKIIKNRPYKSTDELQSRHVIPQSVYNRIKTRIVAQPT